MKKRNLLYTILCSALVLSSCDDYLDTMPDNRAEIDTEDKVTALLVSAYPTSSSLMITEMASDNAMDNGSTYTAGELSQQQAYLWKDMTEDSNDGVKRYWDACYNAVAAANQALDAIEKMGDTESLSAQKGEALMCRAYGHFCLANLFCLAYNPETADKDLGLPYSLAPETEVSPYYERGTLAELYENINKDIEEGLPLVDDNLYSVPKYHFNRKAAYAFATRFNLYYQKWDKVIEYADVVLGENPTNMLRDWYDLTINTASNWSVRVDKYIDASENTNLLLLPVTSSWGYYVGPYSLGQRYGHANTICSTETGRVTGMWGSYSNLLPFRGMWGFSDSKLVVTKIGGYFQYTDKVNGIGYRKNVILGFSADEALLCRAEAYALKGQLDKAVEDINSWLYTHTYQNYQTTKDNIVSFYGNIKCMPTDNSTRTVKKELNPLGFTVTAGEQEEIIQCLLHLRRIETIHEGLRWQDIKRYGIEIGHNREGQTVDVLTKDDPRRAFQLPQDVISAGLEANPRNK
jgi:hypothetical protein